MELEKKTIAELDAEGFEGCDISLSISLLEYGLASKVVDTDYLYYYGVASEGGEYSKFDWSRLSVDCDMASEYDWADLKSVADTAGFTLDKWLELPQFQQVQDLIASYGVANVFGSSYTGGEFEIIE